MAARDKNIEREQEKERTSSRQHRSFLATERTGLGKHDKNAVIKSSISGAWGEGEPRENAAARTISGGGGVKWKGKGQRKKGRKKGGEREEKNNTNSSNEGGTRGDRVVVRGGRRSAIGRSA